MALRDETQNYTLFLAFIDEKTIRTYCNFQDQRSNFTRLFQSSYSTSFLPENHTSLFVTVDNVGNDKPLERLRARRQVLPVIRWSSNFVQIISLLIANIPCDGAKETLNKLLSSSLNNKSHRNARRMR